MFYFITLHGKDIELLERVQNFFGCVAVGKIYKHGCVAPVYYITYILRKTEVLFNHLDKYPLVTQKLADYNLFKAFNTRGMRSSIKISSYKRFT
ncbi:hypothetical protein OnM2_068049 [Erysiphe neolycopersici]|uniref:Homing endonuclease LAGLIDADG domain-containing protein n=1 Tax=Erysiphe neolycopersici TaxID=212602 RepID=A0A420HLP1_9PEZI|nr:hypothetical protein OnM2_068049 [Erysiphe neolycopersici]